MNDLYNIGYFSDTGDRYRVNFSDSSPLNNNTGSDGALFNLSGAPVTWTGAGRTDPGTFLLPDNTQLSLDGFIDQTVAFLTEGNDYGVTFRGTDQNDAFYLNGFDGFVDVLTSGDVDAWIDYEITEGKDVVVIGAGGVGLNAIQGAAIAGARRIVAVDMEPRSSPLQKNSAQQMLFWPATTPHGAKPKTSWVAVRTQFW